MQTAVSPIRLSELNQLIQIQLEASFRNQCFGVLAETTGISHYPAKNQCYLTLIEKCDSTNTVKASMKARIWGSSYKCIKSFEDTTGQLFKDNIQLLLKVRVHYHLLHGLSLEIEDIDCNYTIGKLALSRQAVLQKLLTENPAHIKEVNGEYLTYNKSLKFAPVLQHIAVISSAHADGFADFMHELTFNRHQYTFKVDEYFAPVQGVDAHKELYKQLVRIYESGVKYDAIVLVRGGGSQLDFQAFDSYLLSKAIARFPIPIITGIGHEKNESVSDLMARLKTKTPTKAAATIIAHNHIFAEKLQQLQKHLILKTNEIIISQELVLNALQTSFISNTKDYLNQEKQYLKAQINTAIHVAGKRLQNEQVKLLKVKFNLHCNSDNRLKNEQFKLKHFANTLVHLDPKNVLKRGYTLVYQEGKLVTDIEEIKPDAVIKTQFYSGEVTSRVEQIKMEAHDQ